MKFLYCVLIGVCAVIGSNTVCCGYSLEERLHGTSNEYPQHRFLWRFKKNINNDLFLLCFLVEKKSSLSRAL